MFVLPDEDAVHLIHDRVLQESGGEPGIRDANLLASALNRPDDRMYYQPESTLAEVAACYAFGLAMNHGFVDGNKRTSLVATDVLLLLNGYQISATPVDKEMAWLMVGSSQWDEACLAIWIQNHIVPVDFNDDEG